MQERDKELKVEEEGQRRISEAGDVVEGDSG